MNDKNDLIEISVGSSENKYFLKLALREIFKIMNITYAKFAELHRAYCIKQGIPLSDIVANRGNLLKPVLNKNIILSIRAFDHIVKNILLLNIIDMNMSMRGIDGEFIKVTVQQTFGEDE